MIRFKWLKYALETDRFDRAAIVILLAGVALLVVVQVTMFLNRLAAEVPK